MSHPANCESDSPRALSIPCYLLNWENAGPKISAESRFEPLQKRKICLGSPEVLCPAGLYNAFIIVPNRETSFSLYFLNKVTLQYYLITDTQYKVSFPLGMHTR